MIRSNGTDARVLTPDEAAEYGEPPAQDRDGNLQIFDGGDRV